MTDSRKRYMVWYRQTMRLQRLAYSAAYYRGHALPKLKLPDNMRHKQRGGNLTLSLMDQPMTLDQFKALYPDNQAGITVRNAREAYENLAERGVYGPNRAFISHLQRLERDLKALTQ